LKTSGWPVRRPILLGQAGIFELALNKDPHLSQEMGTTACVGLLANFFRAAGVCLLSKKAAAIKVSFAFSQLRCCRVKQ
jgi:hypothetical protein